MLQPSQQLSQIEKSVTHLLIATKQLLECLTQWSRQTATEGEVSDVYVRLGYEFNIACRAFNQVGVDTTDLGPVPDMLRAILEDTLSQEASTASLDRYLPRIRDIIINLLHGLKRKQQKLRSRQGRETSTSSITPAQRSLSNGSGSSVGDRSTLTQMLEEVPTNRSSSRTQERRTGSGNLHISDEVPPRTSSVQSTVGPPLREAGGGHLAESSIRTSGRDSRSVAPSLSDSSLSSNTMQALPVLTPEEYRLPIQRLSTHEDQIALLHAAPPPPPKPQDALAALQRGGDLERRASRRYSAYQISKHLGASPSGVPMLPPTQNTPLPNRGKDVRESLKAVRTRGSNVPNRQKSTHRVAEHSPTRGTAIPRRISEEPSQNEEPKSVHLHDLPQEDDSPLPKTPEDKPGSSYNNHNGPEMPEMSATLNGPPYSGIESLPNFSTSHLAGGGSNKGSASASQERTESSVNNDNSRRSAHRISPRAEDFVAEQSPQPGQPPQPGKALTLFLQYKTEIKKIVLPDGSNDLSIPRLQLAFIEKFAWNTHNNGNDLPDIYIQDLASGVRYELEDISDVKENSILVLNVEVLDEVRKHIDEGLGGIRRMIEGVRNVVDEQQFAIKQVSEIQRDAAKNMASIAATPTTAASRIGSIDKSKWGTTKYPVSPTEAIPQLTEVQSLRRDLAVVRQSFSSFTKDINSSMVIIRSKASSVKARAVDMAAPEFNQETGRAYVDAGIKSAEEETESILNRVDDLQDLVEDLRKDVVTRGVRPLPRQLETVSKDISAATTDLKKLQEYKKREKPIWTKIWEQELKQVMEDRQFLTAHDDLVADLEDDLEKAMQTFSLVEQATKQQNLHATPGASVTLRSTSRGLQIVDSEVDPMKAKDGVLGEVRALQPNHETRLEAIERAEKARQRELEDRHDGEFKKELGSFVEEGKLKKSGGVQEAERLRKAKDERNVREGWEIQQSRQAARVKEATTANTAASQPNLAELVDGPESINDGPLVRNEGSEESTVAEGEA